MCRVGHDEEENGIRKIALRPRWSGGFDVYRGLYPERRSSCLVLSSVEIRMQLHVSFDVCLPCHFFSVQDADYPTDEIDVFIFAEAHDRISRVVGMQAIRLIFLPEGLVHAED